jgi:hypothetical protein
MLNISKLLGRLIKGFMKNKRYIVIDKNLGIFLGTCNGEEIGMHEGKIYACFAANNPFKLTTACSFESKESAEEFIVDIFPKERRSLLTIGLVETDSIFPSVVELIKSGHSKYTHDMFVGLFEDNYIEH